MAGMSERLGALKEAYTTGGRRVAATQMERLGKTWITPNVLSASGVTVCILASVIVYFEYEAWWLFLVGSAVFLVGSILDILDGALARSQGLGTPFGAFLDSTLDRVGEAFMLGSIALVFMRDGDEWAVAMAFAAVVGSFLVSYTRAKAEIIGLKGDVGVGSRTERVAVICIGLALAPVGALPWAVVLLTAAAWFTVVQRMLSVKRQLRARAGD
jgi:CDP-diacylglycerol--glycerol-3-phosphate 3-phosphatidyltransferase